MNIVNVGYLSTNYYVLADTSPRLLVDAGWPGTLPKLRHTCKRLGIELADIEYILITHYHPDHAGLVQEVKRAGAKLIVVETQTNAVPALRAYTKPRDNYVDIDLTNNIPLTINESRAFLLRIGIQGEIISTPGHSDDSITLALDEGMAFTGDLTYPLAEAEDKADLIHQSWEKIRALGVKTVYPGHGPVWHI